MISGVSPNVGTACDTRQVQLAGHPVHETFIGIRGSPAKFMVEMRDGQFPTVLACQDAQHLKQHAGVQASGDSDQNSLPTQQEFPCADGLLNMLQQTDHAVMLARDKFGARRLADLSGRTTSAIPYVDG